MVTYRKPIWWMLFFTFIVSGVVIESCSAEMETPVKLEPTIFYATLSVVPVFTKTLSPTITPTLPNQDEAFILTPMLSTIAPTDREKYWLDMIMTNGGCKLPCWMGLQPGIATWQNVSDLYFPITGMTLSLPASSTINKDLNRLDLNSDNITDLNFTLFEKGGVIQRIIVNSELNLPEDSPQFYPPITEVMVQYSLYSIMKQYGLPSRVLIGLRGGPIEPGASWLYSLYIFYDPLGILIYYEGEGVTLLGEKLQVCPVYQGVKMLTMYLQSKNSTLSLYEFLDNETNTTVSHMISDGNLREVEIATDLNLLEFFNELSIADGQSCFESLVSLWR